MDNLINVYFECNRIWTTDASLYVSGSLNGCVWCKQCRSNLFDSQLMHELYIECSFRLHLFNGVGGARQQ